MRASIVTEKVVKSSKSIESHPESAAKKKYTHTKPGGTHVSEQNFRCRVTQVASMDQTRADIRGYKPSRAPGDEASRLGVNGRLAPIGHPKEAEVG